MKSIISYQKAILISQLILCLFSACKEEEEASKTKPSVRSVYVRQSTSSVGSETATISASIENRSAVEIIEYGFVYGEVSPVTLKNGIKKNLGRSSALSIDFEKEIPKLGPGKNYFAKVYVVALSDTIYSEEQDFMLMDFNIYTFYPLKQGAGQGLLLDGFFLGTYPSAKAIVGGIPAQIKTNSNNYTEITVPEGLIPGEYDVEIDVNGSTKKFDTKLTVTKGRWVKRVNFPSTLKIVSTAFELDGFVYVLNYDNTIGRDNKLFKFNPTTNLWTEVVGFVLPFTTTATSFTFQGKVYLLSGGSTGIPNQLWEYNVASNSWLRKADFAGAPRATTYSFVKSEGGYIAFGFKDIDASHLDVWGYNATTDKWFKKTDFPGTDRGYITAVYNGISLFCGSGYKNGILKDRWVYDFLSNTWSQRADYPGKAYIYFTHVSFEYYIFTGGTSFASGSASGRDSFVYDTILDLWQEVTLFDRGLEEQKLLYVGGKLLLFYYNNTSSTEFVSSVWEFIP